MHNKVIKLPELPLYIGERNFLFFMCSETGFKSAEGTYAIT